MSMTITTTFSKAQLTETWNFSIKNLSEATLRACKIPEDNNFGFFSQFLAQNWKKKDLKIQKTDLDTEEESLWDQLFL